MQVGLSNLSIYLCVSQLVCQSVSVSVS